MVKDSRASPPSVDDSNDTKRATRSLGLRDDSLEQRRPLRGQITKREVRAVSLYSMGLRPDSVVWDIGAGTGSVSVEVALIAHLGAVYAIERDESSIALLRNNVERLGSDRVQVILGEAPDALDALPDPDSVFIGGSGGRLDDILNTVDARLRHGGRIVVNLAVLERTQEVYHHLRDLGSSPEMTMINAARGKEFNDGTVRLEAMNPVFIITAANEGPANE